jgi:hypothetical protein
VNQKNLQLHVTLKKEKRSSPPIGATVKIAEIYFVWGGFRARKSISNKISRYSNKETKTYFTTLTR